MDNMITRKWPLMVPTCLLVFALVLELLAALGFTPMPLRSFLGAPASWMHTYFLSAKQLEEAPFATELDLYMAIALFLMPVKIYFGFCYLSSKSDSFTYQNFVISPRTRGSGARTGDWVAHGNKTHAVPSIGGGWVRMAVGSILVTLFCSAVVFLLTLDFGGVPYPSEHMLERTRAHYAAFARGGISAWFAWSVSRLGFASLLLASVACMLRDYAVAFRGYFFGIAGNDAQQAVQGPTSPPSAGPRP